MKLHVLIPCLLVAAVVTCCAATTNQTVVYSWASVEYDWPSEAMKQEWIANGKFVVENNIITGIKTYKGQVYLTVPRWRNGVPSSLNKVVVKDGRALLQPYPSWADQTVGDCGALQYVQSMEVDPNTGLMWIIDTGRVNTFDPSPDNRCPPKLVIYDMEKSKRVHTYTFPHDVANYSSCFLDDLVLDYVSGDVKFVYITDTSDAKLYVYDVDRDESYFFTHSSMEAEEPSPKGDKYPIDGIAMSPDFDFVYYCPLSGLGLYQVPTAALRVRTRDIGRHVRHVGQRPGRTGGIAYGQRDLFYSLIDLNAVHRWRVDVDAAGSDVTSGKSYADVLMVTVEELAQDDVTMRFVDTFGWGEDGYLWFTTNDLLAFLDRSLDMSGDSGVTQRVWKMYVGERSYLHDARHASSRAPAASDNNARSGAASVSAVWSSAAFGLFQPLFFFVVNVITLF